MYCIPVETLAALSSLGYTHIILTIRYAGNAEPQLGPRLKPSWGSAFPATTLIDNSILVDYLGTPDKFKVQR
jgi:hypothetical protein